MSLIDELFDIEREAYRKSPIHVLDPRIKLIICLLGLLMTVILPYGTAELGAFLVIYMLFWGLYLLSGTSIRYYLLRLLLIMPFGLFFIILQPFLPNPYYDVYHVATMLPFGIKIYWESIFFGFSLFAKFVISLSYIILLSATTTMQKMLEGAARLHMPHIFVTVMGLTIRYLFVFALVFRKIQSAFAARCFNGFDKKLPLRYRLTVMGNAAGSLFLRALDQGERTYISMCCRGYSAEAKTYYEEKPLGVAEWVFLIVSGGYLIIFPSLLYLML
jgi:cobalt/nickel transport system permease protein